MKIKFFTRTLIIAMSIIAFSACDEKDDVEIQNGNNSDATGRKYFNVVVGIDVESNSGATYTGAFSDLSSASQNISFTGWGFEVPSVRTAYVYASAAGDYLYHLSYGGGTIYKHGVAGGQNYNEIKMLDVSLAMETMNPRWTKLNEQYAALHNVTTAIIEEGGAYSYHESTGILTAIDLNSFSIITAYNPTGGAKFSFPRSAEDDEKSLHVWRIDAPIFSKGKAYYGINKRSYNPNTAANVSTSDYSATTLVVDFPSFTNPKMISSNLAKGSTQGYRTPVGHADENGDVYQITAAPSHILKITDGEYDNSYDFDLSALLGINAGSNGWFYVGNGIGYVPFYDVDLGIGSDAASWGIARIDLYNKTAVKLNLPNNLWLQQYQSGVLGDDGLYYMAIAPLGENGNIYMFDPKNTTANGFTKGATIKAINSTSAYLGIF